MFDTSKIDVTKLGLDAACRMAYSQGFSDGRAECAPASYMRGVCDGNNAVRRAFDQASTVKAVYRNKENTVLEFEDGSKSKVAYDPSFGYGYDYEKAIMAAMLKNLVGNYYIKVLREFVPEGAVQMAANNTGRDMIRKDGQPACDGAKDGRFQSWDVVGTPDGEPILVAPEPPDEAVADDEFLQGLAEEPDLNDMSLFQN